MSRLAGPFADEVVANLPSTGFELRAADVAAWLNSHSSTDGWSRTLSLTLLLGATSFIPAPAAWGSASSGIRAEESSQPCPEGLERHKSGRCVPPCPRGQLRHPAGYCTCGVAVGDAASTMASCVEAIQGM